MISVQVRGIEHVTGNVTRASREAVTALERALGRASIMVARRLRERMSAPAQSLGFWGKGSPAGAYLGVRTGRTRARLSPGGIVFRSGSTVTSAVGSPDLHVKQAEEGGDFAGSSPGGFHRIPTALAQKPSGEDINAGRSVRGLPGYRLIRTSSGKLWIVRDKPGSKVKGLGARADFMYLLVRSVHKRPRGIFAEVAREMAPEALSMAGAEVSVLTEAANQ